MRALLSRFVPGLTPVSQRERLRSAAGALVGILATGLISRAALGSEALRVLIAPMGASAVLLFAVPASPLAQPWSILSGNIVAALVGVTAAAWIADPPSGARVGFRASDLDAALADFDQYLDVDRRDLEQILRRVQMPVYGRRSGPINRGAIMSRDVGAVAPDAPLVEALRLLAATGSRLCQSPTKAPGCSGTSRRRT